MNVRALAAKTLAPILRQERSLQSEFDLAIAKVSGKDKGFFHTLCFGCLRHFELLEAVAQQLLSKKLKNKDQDIHALILLGLYQIHFLRTPDHATLAECVNATKSLKKPWAKGLVNAVLRQFLREQEALIHTANTQDTAKFCLPTWLLKQLQNDWPDQWQDIAQASQEQAPLFVRINTLRTSLDEAETQLQNQGCGTQASIYSPSTLVLTDANKVNALAGFDEGWLSVQDEAAQFAAPLLDLKAGQRVLDACAAPGGKTCHIAEMEPELLSLLSLDIDDERTQRIHENITRLKLSAEIQTGDAATPDTWWNGQLFDRILLDAPCSATGVIRRHPDIKRLRRAEDISQLNKVQISLLESLWPTLQPGGILLYATCSILKAENEAIVATFMASCKDVEHEVIDRPWGQQQKYGRQLFPQTNGHDGFYYARLRKIN